MSRISVLVVDDSAVVRQVLAEIINKDPALELMAAVADPIFAMKRMEMSWPDVIVLDIEMPRMDGITFLKKIMSERPTPVVICSTLAGSGAETTMQALDSGAVGIVEKPKVSTKQGLHDDSKFLLENIKAAGKSDMSKVRKTTIVKKVPPSHHPQPKMDADVMLAPASRAMNETTEQIVALGTSTGGTQALEAVLTQLPRTCPGIVVVQHMPEKFTAAFAGRLNGLCEIKVKEAVDGDRVILGQALIAPGGKHMMLKRSGAKYYVEVADGPLVSRHKPSVDVLFRSVAKSAGKNALAIIMTGMGDDGAKGIKEMHDVGARTLAQNKETCVVFGMPNEAVKLGAIDEQIGLDEIPESIANFTKQANWA